MTAVFKNLTQRFFANRFSQQLAKNRLQMVLVQDRSGLTPQEMELFRNDLLDVFAKYFLLERKSIDIDWERAENSIALVINTPVMRRSTRAGAIAAAAN